MAMQHIGNVGAMALSAGVNLILAEHTTAAAQVEYIFLYYFYILRAKQHRGIEEAGITPVKATLRTSRNIHKLRACTH